MGFIFFILDTITDIILVVQYHRQGEFGFFRLTLIFIVAPLLVMNIMAVCHHRKCSEPCLKSSLGYLFSSLITRYVEQFRKWKRMYWDNSPSGNCEENCNCENCTEYRKKLKEYYTSVYDIAWLRYIETIAESAPQWCLQVGIMFAHWDFPWLTAMSSFFFLLFSGFEYYVS